MTAKELMKTIIPTDIDKILSKPVFTITDESEKEEATAFLSLLNKRLDSVVAYKESKTKPLNEALKIIRAETKPYETKLEDAIAAVRKSMTAYQNEAVRIANEAADKIAARVGEGKGKLKAETAMNKINEIDKPANAIATTAGSVKFRPVKKFEVVDLKKVPMEYHLANETAIREAMKAGTELPGVKYWIDQEVVNSR